MLMNIAYVAGACYCGFGILMGTISYGTFTAILQLISQLQNPLANISGILPRFYAMLASAERLIEVEDIDDANTSERKSLQEVQEIYQDRLEKIVLSDISFSYLCLGWMPEVSGADNWEKDLREENGAKLPTLSGWDFEIQKGEYVAITGSFGCGKSTLLKLLMCLYQPDSGERFLQINGNKIPLDASWQRLFAYVPQGNYLLNGTIR